MYLESFEVGRLISSKTLDEISMTNCAMQQVVNIQYKVVAICQKAIDFRSKTVEAEWFLFRTTHHIAS